MIDAANPSLNQRPEAFDGVRVNFADHVNALAVIDSFVSVSASIKPIVGAERISEHNRLREYVFLDESAQRVGFNIGSDERPNLSFALDHADNRSLFSSPSACPLGTASVIGLIHFDFAIESANRPALFVGQHGANLLEHAPRGFVGDASLALNLLCGDSATGLRHEVDRIEPSRKRSGRLVKDRASGRMNVMATMVAGVRWTAHNAMMLGHGFTLLAIDALWVEAIAKPLKAARVIWELFLEIFQGIREHVRFAVVVGHLVTYCQVKSYQM